MLNSGLSDACSSLAGVIVTCCWASYLTFTEPLSTKKRHFSHLPKNQIIILMSFSRLVHVTILTTSY